LKTHFSNTFAALFLSGFTVLSLLDVSAIHADQDEIKKPKDDRERLLLKSLGWLPENTETLFVTNGRNGSWCRDRA